MLGGLEQLGQESGSEALCSSLLQGVRKPTGVFRRAASSTLTVRRGDGGHARSCAASVQAGREHCYAVKVGPAGIGEEVHSVGNLTTPLLATGGQPRLTSHMVPGFFLVFNFSRYLMDI